ncbi:MAG: YfhO family protein [Planctomycetes bacterium]|nr:YfhO family protein [Planctomycetota bacterium]
MSSDRRVPSCARDGPTPGQSRVAWLVPGLFAVLFLLAALAFIFPHAFFLQEFFYRGELLLHALPAGEFLACWMKQDVFPLWNHLVSCGHPYAADPLSAAFYPFQAVAFLIFGSHTALNIIILSHFVLAGASLFAFGRGVGLSSPAALAGGLIFMLNGYALSQGHHPEALRTFAWLPLLLLCAGRSARGGSPLWTLVLGLVLGIQFLGGDAACAWGNTLAAAAYFFFVALNREMSFAAAPLPKPAQAQRRAERIEGIAHRGQHQDCWPRAALRLAARAAAALALGLGLSAVQWLPTRELAFSASDPATSPLNSRREAQALFSASTLVKVVAPNLDGGSADSGPLLFLGSTAVLLLIPAVRTARKRLAGFCVVLAAGGLLLAAGPYSPLWRLLQGMPDARLGLHPGRFVFLALAAASILASLGLEVLEQASERERRGWARWLALIWLDLTLLVILLHVRRLYLADLPWNSRGVLGLGQFRLFLLDLGSQSPGLLLALWVAQGARPHLARWFGPVSLILVLLNLYLFPGVRSVQVAPAPLLESDPGLVEAIRDQHPPGRVFVHPALAESFHAHSTAWDMASMGLLDEPIGWANDGLVGATPMRYGIAAASGCCGPRLRAWIEYAHGRETRGDGPEDEGGRDFDGFLYRPERVRRLGCSWILMSADRPLPDALAAEWTPSHGTPRVQSYHHEGVNLWPVASSAAPGEEWPEGGRNGEVLSFDRESPNRMVVELSDRGARHLVFREAAYPGWRVWSGGAECRTGRTDRLFLSAELPGGGARQVEATFEPRSFKLGLWVTFLALASLGVALAWRRP